MRAYEPVLLYALHHNRIVVAVLLIAAAVTVPVWLSVTLACWPRRDADAVQPLCPCGCGYPPNKHNPNRSA